MSAISRQPFKFSVILLLLLLSGCAALGSSACRLPCQLGIDQREPLIVKKFLDALVENGWIQDDLDRQLHATYGSDKFSGVLETTTLIELNGSASPSYSSEIKLYIGSVGGINSNDNLVPADEIQLIQLSTNLPIPLTWLLYGLPEGGSILPFYLPDEIDETHPCPNQRDYIAYHDDGNTIVRAIVEQPVLLHLWTTPVEIVYPIEKELEFSAYWIGRFESIDHERCMIGN